jgi:hypothetical protein
MSAKKKGAIQSKVTLLDFFNPGSGSSSKEKEKTRIPAKATPAKAMTLPQDVIVVDSDSDDEPIEVIEVFQATSRKKRRRLSESSGEVEFVDPPPTKRKTGNATNETHGAQKMKEKNTQRSSLGSISALSLKNTKEVAFSEPSLSTSKFAATSTENSGPSFASFGAPSLLPCNPITSKKDTASNSATVSFGAPSLLLPRDNQPSFSSSHITSPTDAGQDPSHNEEEACPALDDDWGMGDDEAAFVRSPEDGIDEYLEELRISLSRTSSGSIFPIESETLAQCPSCDQSVAGWSQSVSTSSCTIFRDNELKFDSRIFKSTSMNA